MMFHHDDVRYLADRFSLIESARLPTNCARDLQRAAERAVQEGRTTWEELGWGPRDLRELIHELAVHNARVQIGKMRRDVYPPSVAYIVLRGILALERRGEISWDDINMNRAALTDVVHGVEVRYVELLYRKMHEETFFAHFFLEQIAQEIIAYVENGDVGWEELSFDRADVEKALALR